MIGVGAIIVPVVCPVVGCGVIVECSIEVELRAEFGLAVLGVSSAAALAEVAAHLMAEHPDACEPAPVEP